MGGGASFPMVQIPKERIIIVTGATSGLGYEIAKWTAMLGATVIMACRSEEKTRQVIKQMNAEFKAEKDKGTQGLTDAETLRLEFIALDCVSYQSVVQFVENFKKSGRQLHVLFCNAGAGLGPLTKTKDGFELQLQVNYLSQFLLTAKLLPIMKNSGPDCRVLFMSSVAEGMATFDMKTINYSGPESDYAPFNYYGRSKLYQIMQMYSMCKRLKDSNITINSIHPGAVKTSFGSDVTKCYLKCLICCISCCGQDAYGAAKCSIDLAVSPKMKGVTGVYFSDFKSLTPSATARNAENQEQLWEYSLDVLKQYMTPEEVSAMEGK